jgi:hypothetical protein
MTPEVLVFAQVSAIIVMLVGSLATIGVLANHVVQRSNRPQAPRASMDDKRLQHLQESIDTIAIEVERIAEAQRFSAKLLAERSGDEALGR